MFQDGYSGLFHLWSLYTIDASSFADQKWFCQYNYGLHSRATKKIINQNVGDLLNALESQVVTRTRNPSTWEIKTEQDQELKVTSLCRELETA